MVVRVALAVVAVLGGGLFARVIGAQAVTDVGDALAEVHVPGHELLVHLAVLDDVVADVVEDGQVGLRLEDHAVVGQLEAAVLEGGEHMHFAALVGQAAVGDAAPQHRVHLGHVRAPEHEGVGLLDVVIAAHRLVDAEGAHEADHRRGHAVAGVGVDVVGAQAGLVQLGGGVAFPDGPLAGAEHGDRVRAVILDGLLPLAGHQVQRFVPAHRGEVAVLVIDAVLLAQQRGLHAVGAVHDLGQEVALDAVQATVDRRIRVALGGDHLVVLHADQYRAAGAAEAARRLVPAHGVLGAGLFGGQHGGGDGHACGRGSGGNSIGLDEIASVQ